MSERSRFRVLLVEDNPADVLLLADALGVVPGIEFDITVVERLSDAMEHLAWTTFDVALLDLSLPDSVGLATFSEFHRHTPDIPVLILTALEDENIAIEAVQQGAQDFLIKPQLPTSLLGRFIRFAIERHRLQQALERVREEEKQDIEIRSMERLSQPTGTAITAAIYSGSTLRRGSIDEFNSIVKRYGDLLDVALEARAHKDEHGCTEQLRQLGTELGFLRASPRDVIDIHASALKIKTLDVHWRRAQAYLDEGRLIIIELMGNLAGYYRGFYVGPTTKRPANE